MKILEEKTVSIILDNNEEILLIKALQTLITPKLADNDTVAFAEKLLEKLLERLLE